MNHRVWAAVGILIAFICACNTTLDNQCWPSRGGGAGGGEVIVPATGVGATAATGDFEGPPRSPQDAPDGTDPCNSTPAPPAPARFGDCQVTWRSGSPQCPGKDDCTTEYQTTTRYHDLAEVKADCEKAMGLGNGSAAKACTCEWLDPGTKPAATYYCSGEIPCSRVEDGYGSGCTLQGRAVQAANTTEAMKEAVKFCAAEVSAKFPGTWVCKAYVDKLTCSTNQPNGGS